MLDGPHFARIAATCLALLFAFPATALATPKGNSAATMTGSFADSCRDFSADSSKDISHVEIHFADGRVAKDESTRTPVYAIDGGAGDEIDSVVVKSGTTTSEPFVCHTSSGPPTALLEIRTPAMFDAGGSCSFFSPSSPEDLYCGLSDPRTVWTRLDPGNIWWFTCGESSFPFTFSGTSSSDPDGDIASWSIEFGDGTSASGNWVTDPPTQVLHDYTLAHFSAQNPTTLTMTVTDAAGHSDSDTMTMGLVAACND